MALKYYGEFIQRLKNFIEHEVPTEFKRRQIEIIALLYDRLVFYTPIDTGHARGNWRVTFNRIKTDVLGSRKDPSPTLSSQRMRTDLEDLPQGSLSPQGISKTIWVYNNVHYIQALEDGRSKDPSKGFMVLRATADVRDFMETMNWGPGGKGNVMTTSKFRESRGF